MKNKNLDNLEVSLKKKRKRRKLSKYEKDLFFSEIEYDGYYNKIKSLSNQI